MICGRSPAVPKYFSAQQVRQPPRSVLFPPHVAPHRARGRVMDRASERRISRRVRIAAIATTVVATLVISHPGNAATVRISSGSSERLTQVRPRVALLWRRSADWKARIYSRPYDLERRGDIQVLDKLCNGGDPERTCVPAGVGLQNALSSRVDVALTWVSQRDPGAGVFWVFSPVRFDSGRAHFRYTWSDPPSPSACAGNGVLRFRWRLGAWRLVGGSQATGCPTTLP